MKWSLESSPVSQPSAFSFGSLRLETDGTLHRGEEVIHLAPKEESVLRLLLQRGGKIVTPSEIRDELWQGVHVTPDSISRCLSSLRSRLEPDGCIQTVYKRGYRVTGPILREGETAGAHLPRLAIMPLATGPQVAAYLGPGIAEEVSTRLTGDANPRLAVVARDSVFGLAAKGLSAQQVGEALQADLVLTGTILALPVSFRLRAEMIRVSDGTQIWVEDMLTPRRELADLQAELADRLVFRLNQGAPVLFATPAERLFEAETDPAVYESYLQGHHEWMTLERHRMQDGAQQLARATDMDPRFIAAQIDLARVRLTQAHFGYLAPAIAAEQVRHIADTIPDVAESAPALLPLLGWIAFFVDRDLPEALRLFSLSAHLPHDPWTTRARVMFALSRHRFEEAHEWLQEALKEDPFAPWIRARLAWTEHLAGHPQESLHWIDEAVEACGEDQSVQLTGAMILAFQGQTERALSLSRSLTQRKPYLDMGLAAYGYALACAGQREEAAGLRERLQWLGRERYVLNAFTPALCLALGDAEGALEELRASERMRCPWFFETLADPRLEKLHDREGFRALEALLAETESAPAENQEDMELVAK